MAFQDFCSGGANMGRSAENARCQNSLSKWGTYRVSPETKKRAMLEEGIGAQYARLLRRAKVLVGRMMRFILKLILTYRKILSDLPTNRFSRRPFL